MLNSKLFYCLRFVVVPLAFLVEAGCAQLPAAQPIEIEIADYRSYLPDEHPVRQGMRDFAQRVETKSEGALKIRLRTDALPGSPAAQLAGFIKGVDAAPQMMLFAGTGLVSLHSELGFLDLPFVLRNEQHADALLSGAFGQALLDRLAGQGVVGLAFWENGFRHVTSGSKPRIAVKDFEGVKFRVAPDAVFENTFKVLGVQAKQLPFSGLRQALADKSVDAQDNFLAQIWTGRLYEQQPYLTMTHHSYGALVLAANEAFWTKLSPAQRSLLKQAAQDSGAAQRVHARKADNTTRDLLKGRGVMIADMPAAERSKWQERTESLRVKFKKSMDPELLGKYQ